MPEARIKTTFGEIVIPYTNLDDLGKGLADIDSVIKAVEVKVGNILPLEPRAPKPGLEDIYRFTYSGRVELLGAPGKQTDTVGLVVFAHDPEPVPSAILEQETGVEGVVRNILTTGAYKKYFLRLADGRYTLTPEGKTWVVEQVIPKLRVKTSQK
jgi:hypothetical protein